MSEHPTVRRGTRAAVLSVTAAALMLGGAGIAAAADGADTHCSVPNLPLLHTVAANVDPDSLEGCGYFEDPNFHDNRRAAVVYNPHGLFSTVFGR